jgi:hypothetical protein
LRRRTVMSAFDPKRTSRSMAVGNSELSRSGAIPRPSSLYDLVAFLSGTRLHFGIDHYALCIPVPIHVSRAANRPCDGRHQKRECNTNFFFCLLVRRYRIDALALPLVCFAPYRGSRSVFLPCATNTLVNTRQGRRFAQAALKLCGWLGQRRDLGACPTFLSLNVELVACRTLTSRTKRHERRCE